MNCYGYFDTFPCSPVPQKAATWTSLREAVDDFRRFVEEADRAKMDLTRATGRIFTIKIERIGS